MHSRSKNVVTSPTSTPPSVRLALILTAVAVVYACDRAGPTEPPLPEGMPNVAVTPGVTTLCQVGLGATFEVRVGLNAAPRELSIPDGGCETVATVNPAQQDDVVVSVAEKPGTYYVVDRLVMQHGDEPARVMAATSSASFEGAHGAVLTFFNNAAVNVCEFGAGASFQYQVGLGTAFRELDVPDGQCTRVASVAPATASTTAAADDMIVTVREVASPRYRLDNLELALGALSAERFTDRDGISFEARHGATVTFRNRRVP
jgi:hypothetical protein